jgi:ubiquinone biosynthesis protein
MIRGLGQLRRLWQIRRVVARYGLGELLGTGGRRLGLWPSAAMRARPLGVRIREALEELGPVFVKLGQALSTRPDLLPPDIASELAKLQDEVPPFPGEVARALVEKAYGFPLEQVFEQFDTRPLASASVAQVHAARLKPAHGEGQGMDVVVKVLRPGIEQQIRRDVDLMYTIAALVERHWEQGKRLHPVRIVEEYEKVIFDELDLLREGANASQLRRNWLGSELIYHPQIFFDYSRPNVLVMERVYGIPIDDIAALKAAGVNFQVLAERGVQIFFNQVFRDNFFHADMHPGNIFVDVDNPEQPRYVALDFGIVGSLSPGDQRYLAENFLAFFNHDYRRVAELHVESEWVPPGTRVDEFESAIRSVCEPIFNRPLKDISFGMFLVRLFQVARRFHMEVQPQLVLLQKTILNIEGLGRQLYPELDLWKTAKPIMEEWMRNRIGPRATLERFRDQMPTLAETLPQLAHGLLRRLESGHFQPGAAQRQALAELRAEIERGNRRNRLVLAGATFLIGAVVLMGFGGGLAQGWGGVSPAVWLLGGAGLYLWWRAFRNRD